MGRLHHARGGFTLIEMSVVLVIIGLLTGAILAGQSLIRAAYVRSTATQLERFNTAVTTFKTKYDCLPGLCANGSALGLPGPVASNTTYELWMEMNQLTFWNQLFAAHLIADYWPINWIQSDAYQAGGTSPTCPICRLEACAGILGPTCYSGGWTPWQLSALYANSLNCSPATPLYNSVGSLPTKPFVWQISHSGQPQGGNGGTILPTDAMMLDQKIDDGQPLTGSVVAISSYTYSTCALDGNSAHAVAATLPGPHCVNTTTNSYLTTPNSSGCGDLGSGSIWAVDLLLPATFDQ